MSKPLIIVESPTKIKTLQKYVGKNYKFAASAGHIRDLPVNTLGIDIENDFKAEYVNIKDKVKVISSLKQCAKNTDEIFLAPDPDREGEAIAFHIMEILKKKSRKFHRILIHEMTQKGITEALKNPFSPDENKYSAQQARRKLDRIVGYQISPLLWLKIQQGLSAGRVQSVALKIICDREKEIRKFIPEEYWSVTADLMADQPPIFNAALIKINEKKLDNRRFKIANQAQADDIVKKLSSLDFIVDQINKRTVRRTPFPPFITSKLQQDAINRLGFSAKKTMIVAQQLYEGIEIGAGGQEGLITYIRTDSTRIAPEAANEALEFIRENYGKDYALSDPRIFQNKTKTQDAHEAIRPTSMLNTPEKVGNFLSKDQFRLYELIWKRFIASQMSQAVIDQKTIIIKAGEAYTFSVTGSTVKFDGFMILYTTSEKGIEKNNQELPDLKKGMSLSIKKIIPKQHVTKPPPRFSEASLVKELEKNGIGRPSTYASILSVIKNKGYVDLVNRQFIPSELGIIVNDLLVASFPDLLDISFTAQMEDNLDDVESGTLNEVELLSKFYNEFKEALEQAKENMISMKRIGIETDLKCPYCEKKLNIKIGKNGQFIACTGYPECSFSSNYSRDEKGNISILERQIDNTPIKSCPNCGQNMIIKDGRFGSFLACTGYPECKYTESVNQDNKQNVNAVMKCFHDGCNGAILEKRSKRGKIFYGCSNYPECKFASWDKPVDKKCPQCHSPYMVEKENKKRGKFLKCPNKECEYTESVEG